jgi:2-iminobutanoate/2-iminopropanoate deaminase
MIRNPETSTMQHRISTLAALTLLALAAPGAAEENGRKVVATLAAPSAIGPYSQAIRVGNTVYVSGEIAIDPKTNQAMANATIEEQTRRALENIRAILAAAALTMEDVVSTTAYLTDVNEFDRMNQVYATFFKAAPPARATVQVVRLARDVKIEISAIAVAR